jgi:hypothetical protein
LERQLNERQLGGFSPLLEQMQLSGSDFVSRFRELTKIAELVRVSDGALPLSAWVAARHDGTAAIALPFERSVFGWENTTAAGAVNAEVMLSLEGVLPRGYECSGLRLEYAANQSIGTGVLLQLCRFNLAAGTIERGQSVVVAAAPTAAFTHKTVALYPTGGVRAVAGQEQFVSVRITGAGVGGVLRVKALHADYAYTRARG